MSDAVLITHPRIYPAPDPVVLYSAGGKAIYFDGLVARADYEGPWLIFHPDTPLGGEPPESIEIGVHYQPAIVVVPE